MSRITGIAAAVVVALGFAGAAGAQTVGGRYAVEGRNPNGSTYEGFAEISGTAGGQCSIVWRIPNTPPTDGFCMRQGDVFVAAYRLGERIGLAVYRADERNVLDGTWSIRGDRGVGRERLVPMR